MLSRYEIRERIGSGGFGVVHRAEDTTLRRPVAIKFLSDEPFKKSDTRARFQREARLAASLNHPNICTVHEVGEVAAGEEAVLGGDPVLQPGTPFIVMELVEGRSLDEALRDGKPLPLTRLLEIAVQVAEGLAEAHSRSIVHRDLKPKNVMVTDKGRAKILDFGMAKPLDPDALDDPLMRTTHASSLELTREGMILGTVAYMSPEQATGKSVDSRSDVFSLGVMLYEMATARNPFQGDSATSTLAKILETEPRPLADSREDLPYELSRIIHRCLRKNPDDRYNDTRDLAVALRDLLQQSSGAVRRAEPGSRPAVSWLRSRAGLRALAIVGLVLAGVAFGTVVPPLLWQGPGFAAPAFRQVTFTGSASFPSVSPDGQSLAYVVDKPGGGYQVVVQDLAGGQQLPIFEAALIRSLRWSPAGSEILVSASASDEESQTYLVPRLGGSARPLRYLPFVAWGPGGDRFAGAEVSGKQIWFMDTSTGAMTSIDLSGEFSFIYEIDWSANGEVLAFRTTDDSDRHAIWTTTVDGGRQQMVVEGTTSLYSPRFSPGGDAIYYLSGVQQAKDLWKIEIDSKTGERRGDPVLLLSGLQAGDRMTFSRDGRRLLYARAVAHTNLWLVDHQGSSVTTQQLTPGTFRHGAPRFSPDGSRLAMTRRSSSKPELFVMGLDDRRQRQLTFLDSDIWQPVWSPDGSEIAFGAMVEGTSGVMWIDARGGTPLPFTDVHLSRDLAWAPGAKILYQLPGDSGFRFVDPRGGAQTPFLDDSAGGAADPLQFFSWMASPEYSPDGREVAFSCNCPGGQGLWVASLEDSSSRLIHGDIDARPVGWSPDGAWVYAFRPQRLDLLRVDASGRTAETYMEIPFETVEDVDISPDGDRIVVSVPVSQADVWLIENFDPDLR